MITRYLQYLRTEAIRHFAIWWLLCTVLSFLARIWLIAEGQELSLPRGWLSDALLSIIPALIFTALPFAAIRTLMVFLWCTIVSSNIEHIVVNDSNVSAGMWGYAMDETFIFGSLLVKAIFVRTIVFYIAISALYHVCTTKYLRRFSGEYFYLGVLSFALFMSIWFWPIALKINNWQQMSAVEENIRTVWSNIQNVPDYFADQGMPASVYPYYVKDLKGKPIAPELNERKYNILMIIIEGLGDTHVRAGWTPNLARMTDYGVHYTQFINNSTRTMNGLYALFCGDHPQMLTGVFGVNFAKKPASLYKNDFEKHPCLPERLRNSGYTTTFLQGAGLGYGKKGKFIEKAGFEHIKGRETFPKEALQNKWGVSDRDLFTEAVEEAKRLDKSPNPWFLSVFNVGTHHPYNNVPEDFMPELSGIERATRYMDEQLNHLLWLFEFSAINQNTILIITNDETHITRGVRKEWGNALSDNQGFMLMLLPEGVRKQMDTPFLQSDFLLSMLDYLNLDHSGTIGRSMFRDYVNERPYFFGQPSGGRLYIKTDKNNIITCFNQDLCQMSVIEGGNIFTGKIKQSDKPIGSKLAQEIVEYNDHRWEYWLKQNAN